MNGSAEGPDVQLVEDVRDLRIDGVLTGLTPTEYAFVRLLASTPTKYVAREVIGISVWGYYDDGVDRAIDTHVNRIRRKTAPLDVILTRRGVGYATSLEFQGGDSADSGALAILDLTTQIVWAEPGVAEILRMPLDQVLGRSVLDFIDASEHELAKHMAKLAVLGSVIQTVVSSVDDDGDPRLMRIHGEMVADSSGAPICFVTRVWACDDGAELGTWTLRLP